MQLRACCFCVFSILTLSTFYYLILIYNNLSFVSFLRKLLEIFFEFFQDIYKLLLVYCVDL